MNSLLWFRGVDWDTPVGDIAWTYIALGFLLWQLISLVKKSR